MIIVIAILGVLAAIALPQLSGYLGTADDGSYKTDKKEIQSLMTLYFTDPANPKTGGSGQFPIYGPAKATNLSFTGDGDIDPGVPAGGISAYPYAAKLGLTLGEGQ